MKICILWEAIDTGFYWIAQDGDGEIWLYATAPAKDEDTKGWTIRRFDEPPMLFIQCDANVTDWFYRCFNRRDGELYIQDGKLYYY